MLNQSKRKPQFKLHQEIITESFAVIAGLMVYEKVKLAIKQIESERKQALTQEN